MNLVALMTRSGVYQGKLLLESPVGQPLRLIDVLNHPQRLKQQQQRAGSHIELVDAVRRDLHGQAVSCGPLVGISGDALLAAYEVMLDSADGDDTMSRAYEARQEMRDATAVFLVLENGFRLTGEVGGGLNVVDNAKPGRHFLTFRDVRLMAPGRDTVLELAEVAVNALRLEASGTGTPW